MKLSHHVGIRYQICALYCLFIVFIYIHTVFVLHVNKEKRDAVHGMEVSIEKQLSFYYISTQIQFENVQYSAVQDTVKL